MICKKCGEEIDDSAKFCKNCGESINKKKSKWGVVVVVLILLCLIAAGLFTYVEYFSDNAKYEKWMSVGREQENLENYDEAISAYEMACLLNDTSNDARLELADLYTKCGEIEKAKLEYNDLLKLDPANKNVYILYAEIWINEGNKEAAKEILEEGYIKTGDKSIKKSLEKIREEIEEEQNPELVSFEVENFMSYSTNISGTTLDDPGLTIKIYLPRVRETVPNAYKINTKLKEQWDFYKDAIDQFKANDFSLMTDYNLCMMTAEFEVYQYKNYCALVFKEMDGRPNSGGDSMNTVYYYDIAKGDQISSTEYASDCELEESTIIQRYNDYQYEVVNDIDEVPFYVDSNGKLEVLLNAAF